MYLVESQIDELQKIFKEDSDVIDSAYESIKYAFLREEEMRKYNENLKATFDSEVQKTAMRILESTATGMNDGGGSLKYTNN